VEGGRGEAETRWINVEKETERDVEPHKRRKENLTGIKRYSF
jgi:hypothetical protein